MKCQEETQPSSWQCEYLRYKCVSIIHVWPNSFKSERSISSFKHITTVYKILNLPLHFLHRYGRPIVVILTLTTDKKEKKQARNIQRILKTILSKRRIFFTFIRSFSSTTVKKDSLRHRYWWSVWEIWCPPITPDKMQNRMLIWILEQKQHKNWGNINNANAFYLGLLMGLYP